MKVTVVGAGNVGATCANVLAHMDFLKEVVLLDIKKGTAEGKALDIWQTAPINMYSTRTVGVTDDYAATANSDVVVITSGLPRKPGMSRDDLISTNAGIVKKTGNRKYHEVFTQNYFGYCFEPIRCNDVLRLFDGKN
jgi:malate dehydrogenase